MYDEQQICPYTGLRSFTEEESLYFKGREEDIDQATQQLQRNKFLMLTGASGDGKSSLVYAGIIPNARAGFLKAKYTNWRVADFRPERDPFGNLCKAVARELEIVNLSTVEAELGHGFSALADLYRNSKLHIDQEGHDWRQADDRGRAALKRDAANLIVLVDQFEEFFTNPENYRNGAPSKESNMVLNLLLETARISLEEDLPIYVVFTMRSDYIGQCAAFRGLPENIGFSQFFVPRLNRSQLQQVIEEPAVLSGNRITRRLTERLIHDITEGVDQLPILQHALNQVWVAADKGREEMDLIHYAMVGGMSVDELPDEQVHRFKEWFAGLPPYIQACYHKPGLHNVLDTHTNKLYEQAGGYYREHTRRTLSDADAKRIIRSAFTCLTKIDQGRAVRNRMTLEEITHIIGDPAIDVATVGEMLNIFREPGNTFIHPFILHEEVETRTLPADQVLDITHESLIRNWQYLGRWAREEFDSRSVSLDLDVQLDRWIGSGKSKDYLMSIGQLTYFEGWFNKTRPNASWVARYLPGDAGPEVKLEKARTMLDDTREFLTRSAAKHAFTRTIMRYGTKRIAILVGAFAALGLTSFAVADYLKKRNTAVIADIQKDAARLFNDEKVDMGTKASYIVEAMKLGLVNIGDAVGSVKDSIDKLDVANGVAQMLLFQGRGDAAPEVDSSLTITDSILVHLPVAVNDAVRLEATIRQINNLSSTLAFADHIMPSEAMTRHRRLVARKAASWAMAILEAQPPGMKNIPELSLAIENGLNGNAFSAEEIRKLTQQLSPFENPDRSEWLKRNFQAEMLMVRGEQGYGILFNGLYQELAYLYASEGNTSMALRCVDTLLQYSQRNFLGDYANGADNAINIAVAFYLGGHGDQLDAFVQGYCQRKKSTEADFYQRLTARGLYERATTGSLNVLWWMGSRLNLNSRYVSRTQLNFFFDKYRERLIATEKDPNERLYRMALSYKDQGVQESRLREPNGPGSAVYFDTAVALFRRIPADYLAGTISARLSTVDETPTARRSMFIYPDARPEFNPFEPRAFVFYHFTDAFLGYIVDHGLVREFYGNGQDMKELENWLEAVKVTTFNPTAFQVDVPSGRLLMRLDSSLGPDLTAGAELNMLHLLEGREAQKAGDTATMFKAYDRLVPGNFQNILRSIEFGGNSKHYVMSLISYAVKGYYQNGHEQQAFSLVKVFKNPINRASIYAFVATELALEKAGDKLIDRMLDSSKMETSRTEQVGTDQPNRQALASALSFRDRRGNAGEIDRLIKNLPNKPQAFATLSRADGFHQELYEGLTEIPDLLSNSARLSQYTFLLVGYGESGMPIRKGWERYNSNYIFLVMHRIEYVDESN